MNRENIKIVRDHLLTLKDQPERFNMRWWTGRLLASGVEPHAVSTAGVALDDSCGTCACIAGWSQALLSPRMGFPNDVTMPREAGELLGLDVRQAKKLFIPWKNDAGLHESWLGHYRDIPPQAGAMVLNHLLETGEVDWGVIGPRVCYDQDGEQVA